MLSSFTVLMDMVNLRARAKSKMPSCTGETPS